MVVRFSPGFAGILAYSLLAGAPAAFAAEMPASAPPAAGAALRPVADAHQHLLSPMAAQSEAGPPVAATIGVPAAVDALLRAHEASSKDANGMAALLTKEALSFNSAQRQWLRGQEASAKMITGLFRSAYQLAPISVHLEGDAGWVAGYVTRGSGASLVRIGHFFFSLQREDGALKIGAENFTFPGPQEIKTLDADALIKLMDEAGVQKAAVLSLAYFYGSPLEGPVENEYEKVRAENDWTAAEVAKHPKRLVAFCGVNPLKDYAIKEVQRCASLGMRGIKLHFGNSGVDVKTPAHVAKVKALFREANRLKLAITAHLWTLDPAYGKAEAEIFLSQILPEALDITVQIAHMAGAGSGGTDEALAVYVDAVKANDTRVKNLTFDFATVADNQTAAQDALLAQRMRELGLTRVYFGGDGAWDGGTPREEWGTFYGRVPLTEAEFRVIAGNVPPYLR